MSKDKFRTNKGFNEILNDIANYNPNDKTPISEEFEGENFSDLSMEELIAKASPNSHIQIVDIENLKEGYCDISLYRQQEIRKILHNGEWYFSVVDTVGIISQSKEPRNYWTDLKRKLISEGFQLHEIIVQLKLPSKDSKSYTTDCANVEGIFRILQSIPSKKAEPFKKWLAKVGYERILETINPEIAVKRSVTNWKLQGRSDNWIKKRLQTMAVRNSLTDEWKNRGIIDKEYGILTNTIHQGTFGISTEEHKNIKGLKNHNLRDHMGDTELILTMLGESATKDIAIATDAQGFQENKQSAEQGGKIAGNTRKQIEEATKRSVVTKNNFLKDKNKELE